MQHNTASALLLALCLASPALAQNLMSRFCSTHAHEAASDFVPIVTMAHLGVSGVRVSILRNASLEYVSPLSAAFRYHAMACV